MLYLAIKIVTENKFELKTCRVIVSTRLDEMRN